MPAHLMYGQPVVDEILRRTNEESGDTEATLAIVQVGHTAESDSYVTQVAKTAKRVPRMRFAHLRLPPDTTKAELQDWMKRLNDDEPTTGYMLQLPLPPELQVQLDLIREWIDPAKDVDLLGYEQRGRFLSGKKEGQLLPPTPYAVMKMLQYYGIEIRGKVVCVVGDGLVGSMLKIMLGNDGATQIVCNDATRDLAQFTRQADIVVGATGVPNIITGGMMKEGSVGVNIGMKFLEKMEGDLHIPSIKDVASFLTPILKGSGPVTVAALMQNVFRASKRERSLTA